MIFESYRKNFSSMLFNSLFQKLVQNKLFFSDSFLYFLESYFGSFFSRISEIYRKKSFFHIPKGYRQDRDIKIMKKAREKAFFSKYF